MPISRAHKEELVARYVELLKEAQGVIITRNNGMKIAHFNDLRARLRELDSTLMITKNTLFSLALQEVNLSIPEELLKGPVAVTFVRGDIAAAAKAVLAFQGDVQMFEVTGALVEGVNYDAKGVDLLSKLPSFGELRAQLVGLIIAPAAGLVNVINGGATQVLNVIAAYAAKEEGEAA